MGKPDLKIDDEIIVWDSDYSRRRQRYFAEWDEDGKVMAFSGGATSWSNHYTIPTVAWDNFETLK